MTQRFRRLARLIAAACADEREELARSAVACREAGEAEAAREALRQLHLFRGFPLALRAWNVAAPELGAVGREAPGATDAATGEALFRKLYGRDADAVLPHLHALDPVFASWVLDHAYGRVMTRPGLSLEERERLAVLLLAADGCWQQWESHVRNSLRLGIPREQLEEDLVVTELLDAPSHERAAAALAELP